MRRERWGVQNDRLHERVVESTKRRRSTSDRSDGWVISRPYPPGVNASSDLRRTLQRHGDVLLYGCSQVIDRRADVEGRCPSVVG